MTKGKNKKPVRITGKRRQEVDVGALAIAMVRLAEKLAEQEAANETTPEEAEQS